MPVTKVKQFRTSRSIKQKLPKNYFFFPKSKYELSTSNIYISVNGKLFKPVLGKYEVVKFNVEDNGSFRIKYGIPGTTQGGHVSGEFDKISEEKYNSQKDKKFGKIKQPKRILKDFFFNDEKQILGFTYKGDWEIQLKDRYKVEIVIKKFKIQFIKKNEYDKAKEFITPFLELKGKFYQQIKE